MSRTLQFKRYNAATLANTRGANGELIINTTSNTLTIHDGSTLGGYTLVNSTQGTSIDIYARTTANTASNTATHALSDSNDAIQDSILAINTACTAIGFATAAMSKANLKSIVAVSTDFNDFKTRIANSPN
jgi:hypothetical protein